MGQSCTVLQIGMPLGHTHYQCMASSFGNANLNWLLQKHPHKIDLMNVQQHPINNQISFQTFQLRLQFSFWTSVIMLLKLLPKMVATSQGFLIFRFDASPSFLPSEVHLQLDLQATQRTCMLDQEVKVKSTLALSRGSTTTQRTENCVEKEFC